MTNEAAQRVAAAHATRPDLLALDEIGVRLGGRQILSDVTFSLRKGEFTGIIGPNGAGKTTLLRVILGLLEPSGGRVLIDGGPLHNSFLPGGRPPVPPGASPIKRRGYRARNKAAIGYVPQKLVIDP